MKTIEPIEFAHYNALTSLEVLSGFVSDLHVAHSRDDADRALERARDEVRDLLAELEGLHSVVREAATR